ncbi:MAG: prepilin-type N-terminal cleavage/methylation domain-containing protein [Acidobacteria bacterium]|nr:prepilin-type N-terminal cleavage/methylation domain-containing protein [Acidobacteriota bacterium]
MKRAQGFSLIELLIVVAIILIIAAIAVPNLLRSRMAANESSAAQSERNISTASITYSTVYGIGFATEFSFLGPPVGGGTSPTSDGADLIDSALGSGFKSGYDFTTYEAADADGNGIFDTFTAVAIPIITDQTGKSTFCVDSTNVILKDPSGNNVTAGAPGQSCPAAGFQVLGN